MNAFSVIANKLTRWTPLMFARRAYRTMLAREDAAQTAYPFETEQGRALLNTALGRRYAKSHYVFMETMLVNMNPEPFARRDHQLEVLEAIRAGIPPDRYFHAEVPDERRRVQKLAMRNKLNGSAL